MAETQAQQENTNFETFLRKQFTFNGEWLPAVDPMRIGDNNFSDIQNFRYSGTDLEGISGYERITVNPVATYIKGRSGVQIRTPFTISSIVLAQLFNAAENASKVFAHLAVPPATGDFEATELHTDAAGAGIANFAELPLNNALYCNGVESKIYAGAEQPVGAFIRCTAITNLTVTAAQDVTDRVRNTLQDTLNSVLIDSAAAGTFIVFSTRPIQGIKLYIKTPNGSASSLSGKEWDGTTWDALTLTDNTASGGKSMYQTGTVTFASTVSTSKPCFIEGMLLYAYQFTLSAGSATLYHCTVDTPFQNLVNLWDGAFRYCIQCQDKRAGAWEDYTPEVAEVSSSAYPIVAKWGGLTSSDEIILMFSRRTCGIKLTLLGAKVNANTASLTIYYWDGSTWVTVGTVYDGTSVSGKTLAQTNYIYWNSPDEASEFRTTLFNTTGYAYKVVTSATLTAGTGGDGVSVDTLYGFTSPNTMKTYDFGFTFKNRVFLAGYSVGMEPNRLDYGVPDTVDCYCGDESSDGEKQIYVGSIDALVGAVNIFNRFGANLYNSQLLLKQAETYLLDGDGPETFRLFTVSKHTGCPAPRTIVTAEIAYEISKDAVRNIAMWLSARGPVLFDAAILVPLRGVDNYFNPLKDECINFSQIERAHAWFDPNYNEYNLCIPSGTGQVDCNIWLFYNLVVKRWSRKETGAKEIPQATFQVNDQYGNLHTYGLLSDGHMIILETGSFWDDAIIECALTSGEHLPTNDIFDTSFVRRYKLIRETPSAYDISYKRSDFSFIGNGYESGEVDVYGELIEDVAETSVHWDGDNLHCFELIENDGTIAPAHYKVTGGQLRVDGDLHEGWQLELTTVAGNFVAAGFIPGLQVFSDDPGFPGPMQVETVTANKLTMVPSVRGVYTVPGVDRTLTAYFISMEHFIDGETVAVRLVPEVISTGDRYQRIIANCNRVGFTHKVRFVFNSTNNEMKVKPLAWGYQYMVEREDIS
jgi:hypothetical protein